MVSKPMVCGICPNSCRLVITEDNGTIQVTHNQCPRGVEFARKELTDPERMLTSTMRIHGGGLPLVSIRSDAPVKKDELQAIVRQLDGITLSAPVVSGQVVLPGVGKNKVNIIATRTIARIL